MSIKRYAVGFVVVAAMAFIFPKPDGEKYIDYSTQSKLEMNGVEEPEEKQSFDEYASNAINHFVESGTDTPSPWYNTETLEDNAFFNGYSGESPWEPAE